MWFRSIVSETRTIATAPDDRLRYHVLKDRERLQRLEGRDNNVKVLLDVLLSIERTASDEV